MNFRLFFSCFFGVLVSNVVGYVSSFATRSSVNTWYKYLNKPLLILLIGFLCQFGLFFIFLWELPLEFSSPIVLK